MVAFFIGLKVIHNQHHLYFDSIIESIQYDKYGFIKEYGINKKVDQISLVYHDRSYVYRYNSNYTECAISVWCLLQRNFLCSTP